MREKDDSGTHNVGLVPSARARELARLRSLERRHPTTTTLIDPPLTLVDGPSFASQYEDIFLREIYDFRFDGTTPTIIDGGANVGAAVIWWRARWPKARILAFEPDPAIFDVLKWNTRYHQDLELHQRGLGSGHP